MSASARRRKLRINARAFMVAMREWAGLPSPIFYDAFSHLNRCLNRGNSYPAGLLLRDRHLHAGAVNSHRQDLPASLVNGFFDSGPGVRLNEHHDTAAATRAAHFA